VRPTRYLRLTLASARLRVRGERPAHFLHIGKCAGTAVKQAFIDAPEPTEYHVVMHTHGIRMIDLPRGDKFFFVVRDPVDRFVSGFSSRLREDAPRFRSPWTPAEARAFAIFSTPNDVGLALAGSGEERAAAAGVLRSIEHVRTSYWDWFANPAAVRRREGDILWIGFQETLDVQIADLAESLGVPELRLPAEHAAANRSQPGNDLTPTAREALADWYGRDYEFLALCHELVAHR